MASSLSEFSQCSENSSNGAFASYWKWFSLVTLRKRTADKYCNGEQFQSRCMRRSLKNSNITKLFNPTWQFCSMHKQKLGFGRLSNIAFVYFQIPMSGEFSRVTINVSQVLHKAAGVVSTSALLSEKKILDFIHNIESKVVVYWIFSRQLVLDFWRHL